MEKFTKGPWGNNGRLIYSSEKFIATVSQTDITDWDEIESNSALIAAAPEMYEMLNSIAISMECFHGVDTDAIFALLAKARGE